MASFWLRFALGMLAGSSGLGAGWTAQAAPLGEPAPLPGDDGAGPTTPWGPGRRRGGEHFRSTAQRLQAGPLRLRGDDWSLGVGLQYIGRAEARWDRDFDRRAGDDTLGFDQRARLGLQAAWAERLGLLIEVQDVRPWGAENTTTRTVPLAGVHQAFVDLPVCPGFDLRVGRQELAYGEERLIGALDWSQHARAFDGAFGRLTFAPALTVDGFALRLADQVQPAGEPVRVTSAWLTGLYGRWRPGPLDLDLYSLYLNDPDRRTQGRPAQTLLSVGLRAAWQHGGLALVGEGVGQYGRSRPETEDEAVTIGAWAAALRATYTFAAAARPWLGAELTQASGGAVSEGRDPTFRQLFPTGHAHLGYADLVGWQNVQAGRLSGGLHPFGLHLWLDLWHFQKASAEDAWYDASGAPLAPRRGEERPGADRTLGTELDLSVTWPLHEAAALALAYGLFLPGEAAERRDPSHWTFLSLRTQL